MCKKFWSKLNEVYRKFFVKSLKIVVLGTESSGKSSLITTIFENKFPEKESRKHRNRLFQYTVDGIEYTIYDVPGGRENLAKWDYFYKKADVIIYTFDSLSDENGASEAENQLSTLLYRNMWSKRNLLVLGTKNDAPGAMSCKDIILSLNLMDIIDREVSCYSVSAKKFVNLDLVKQWLEEQADLKASAK